MALTPASPAAAASRVAGKIIDTVVKVSVDATRPLPLVCALYAVENSEGVWLCAYYGANRSVFDYLPQKGMDIDEAQTGHRFSSQGLHPQRPVSAGRMGEIQERAIHGLRCAQRIIFRVLTVTISQFALSTGARIFCYTVVQSSFSRTLIGSANVAVE